MKFVTAMAVVIALFAAVPASAQTRFFDVTGYYAMVDPQGDNRPGLNAVDEFELDSSSGFGLGVNAFLTNRLSLELAAYAFESEVTVRPRLVNQFAVRDLDMMPITATLQYHFNPEGRFSGSDLRAVDLEDDIGYVVNAGASFDITPRLAIVGDIKYVPVEASASAVFTNAPDQTFDIEVNPVIVGLGLSYQF
ncbi:MAG: outer membrane beta-barrel protein [Acidobacteria bacterium]|nr:outer membrane beta-barrel protein [Acidobacteriota bacterium]